MDEIDYTQNRAAETSIALNAIQEEALDNLLKDGVSSTLRSTGNYSDNGLEITTHDESDGSDSTLLIKGEEKSGSDFTGVYVNGEYDIERREGGELSQEKASFNLRHSHFDEFRGLSHYKVSMDRETASGQPIESFDPAVSRLKSENGHLVYDQNNQPVRLAESTDGVNCKPDYSRPNTGKMDCEYILNDAELGRLSFNMTRQKLGNGSMEDRSVVRNLEGKVLAILNLNYKTDANGHLESAVASARRPKGYKD